jgi:hypothetical protein
VSTFPFQPVPNPSGQVEFETTWPSKALFSEIGGVNTAVVRLTSELADAQFDLYETVIQALSAVLTM